MQCSAKYVDTFATCCCDRLYVVNAFFLLLQSSLSSGRVCRRFHSPCFSCVLSTNSLAVLPTFSLAMLSTSLPTFSFNVLSIFFRRSFTVFISSVISSRRLSFALSCLGQTWRRHPDALVGFFPRSHYHNQDPNHHQLRGQQQEEEEGGGGGVWEYLYFWRYSILILIVVD